MFWGVEGCCCCNPATNHVSQLAQSLVPPRIALQYFQKNNHRDFPNFLLLPKSAVVDIDEMWFRGGCGGNLSDQGFYTLQNFFGRILIDICII